MEPTGLIENVLRNISGTPKVGHISEEFFLKIATSPLVPSWGNRGRFSSYFKELSVLP